MVHHYPHHIGDYRRDTGHLTNDEDLAYRRMLELYYDTEAPLPNDVEWIARRVQSDPAIVTRVLRDFFVQDGAVWRQSRCDEEIAAYRVVVERNRNNGKNGGRPVLHRKTQSQPKRNPLESQPITKNQEPGTTSQTPEREPRSAREPRREPIRPADVPPQTWIDWLAHRKSKRAPVTETALAGIRREAGLAGITLAAALEHSQAQGWQGFRADWFRRNGAGGKAPQPPRNVMVSAAQHIVPHEPDNEACPCDRCESSRRHRERA